MTRTEYDVIIIGAGALGSCTARDLAADHDVLVVEKDQIAGKAAGHAAGFFSNWWYYINEIVVPGVDEIIYDFWEEYDDTGHFEFHNDDPFVKFVKTERRQRSGATSSRSCRAITPTTPTTRSRTGGRDCSPSRTMRAQSSTNGPATSTPTRS